MTANISQHITRRRYGVRQKHQRGSITHTTITAAFGVSALTILAMLGFFYLQQVLRTASQGTDIHTLESQLIDVKQKQRQLELEGAQLRSLQTVEERVQKLNLAPVNHVSYLNQAPDHVASLAK